MTKDHPLDQSAAASPEGPEAVRLVERTIGHLLPHTPGVRMSNFRRLSGGFSRVNRMFDLDWQEAGQTRRLELLLRTDPASSPLQTERAREYAVLKALEGSAVAAPRVHLLDNDGSLLGAPALVMERMAGRCDWTVLNGGQPLDYRLKVARQFTQSLAALHGIDWQARDLEAALGAAPADPAAHELDLAYARYRAVLHEPLPEMDLIALWLRDNLPPPQGIVLVHGDYKPGNALVGPDGLSAILDWETAHLGDPLDDLGWMLMPSRRKEQQIRDHWGETDILACYEAATGRRFAPEALRWWVVFSTWRLAVNNLAGVDSFLRGDAHRISQVPTWLFTPMLRMIIEEGL